MNVLILGAGGRESAFAWKLAQSPMIDRLFVAPGNPGTAKWAKNLNLDLLDFSDVANAIRKENIEMLLVGPEEPLVKGITDYLSKEFPKLNIIGPNRQGAQLEGSKDFSKSFMQKYSIPTAAYRSFSAENTEEGVSFIRSISGKIVLKADGLAAGKGVLICDNSEEAIHHFRDMIGGKFGEASRIVLVEEFLEGIEVSFFVLTDGKSWTLLPEAKDYKRIYDFDKGPNTGGMGAVSPVPFVDEVFKAKVIHKIIEPTISGLIKEGITYKGFIFIGLMNVKGDPFVIEYNCRMGDPETEAVLPRIDSDLAELFKSMQTEELSSASMIISPLSSVTVVTVSEGYPNSHEKGFEIRGLENMSSNLCFQAGTKFGKDTNTVITNGGRVLAITALGENLESAREKAYEGVRKICYDNISYRNDIGTDLLKSQ
jgi:phosphoribosylamine--glycine ligase